MRKSRIISPASIQPIVSDLSCCVLLRTDGGSHITSIDPGNGTLDVVPNPDGDPLFEDFHVSETVWDAKRRGVLFDVGHGSASFSWTVAEIAAKEGFWPDIVTSQAIKKIYDRTLCSEIDCL